MLIRCSAALAAAMLTTAAAAQTRPVSPPPRTAQPIPRAEFLKNMDADFARMDGNHDGKLAKAEIEASQRATALQQIHTRNQQVFRELDKDRNGQLSPAEFAQFHAEPQPPNGAPMIQHFDTNHDGMIALVEYRSGTLANFDRLDTDKDGIVTAADLHAGGIGKH